MNIVIAGAGKVGYFLANELMGENQVTLIDSNEKTIQHIDDTLDVLSICGDVENPHTYKNIDDDIDIFIAVTDSDEVNLLSSLIIDNIVHVKEKIVRLKNDFFMGGKIQSKLNITDIITPAISVANTFHFLIDFPHANNIKTFSSTKALLLSIRTKNNFEPMMMSTFTNLIDDRVIIAGIERGDNFFIPDEMAMIMPNDLIYFFTFPSQMHDIRKNIYHQDTKQDLKNCIIYGANQLGIEIAKVLVDKGLNIKLIDKTLEGCKLANSILKNHVEVIKSNYNLDFILDNHGKSTDLFIAATTNDEFNITKCLQAKQKGIEKIIGIHNNRQYASLMRHLGIEVIRGEKMNAYYTILEKITSTTIICQRAFCGDNGRVYLRKIKSDLVGRKFEIDSATYEKGNFFIQREKKFISYKHIESFQENDILICFSLASNAKILTDWLKQS